MDNTKAVNPFRRFLNQGPLQLTGAVVAIIVFCSCTQYRMGFLKHPQIKTVAIDSFENHTDEPAMAALLHRKLSEKFSTESALRIADKNNADILVRGNIKSYSTRRSAAAKLLDEDDQPDDRSTYRTNIYTVKINIDFETVIPSQNNEQAITRRTVTGEGNFSEMPDLHTSRRIGLQQALRDAASQIVTGVTEAW